MTRPDRLNRSILTLLGVALTLVGAYGLARSYGAFGGSREGDPLLLENVRTFVGRNDGWFWPVAFLAALIFAFLGFRLLRAQLVSEPRARAIRETEPDGDIVIRPSAIADAVAADLERDPMITHAHAGLGRPDEERAIDLALTVPDDVVMADLRRYIERGAMERARAALQSESIRPNVVLTLGEPARRRIR